MRRPISAPMTAPMTVPTAMARQGFASATFASFARAARVMLQGTALRAGAHVYSLLLTDQHDHPLPLYYT